MDLTLGALLLRVRDTLADPRGSARAIMALEVPGPVGWLAVAFMAVTSTLLAYASYHLSPAETRAFFAEAMAVPLRTAFLQLFVWVAAVFALYRLGRARGGQGTMEQTIALIAWLQFVMIVLQTLALAVQIVVPSLGGLLGLLELAAFFRVLVPFVAELHGFRSIVATFFGVVGGILLLFLTLAVILAPLIGSIGFGV